MNEYKVCERKEKVEETYGANGRKQWNNRRVWEPVPNEKAVEWIKKQASGMTTEQAEPHTNEERKNAVKLDPVRLRFAFPNGVPDVRLPEIFGDPEKYAEIWETLEYVFGGTHEYKNEVERNIDSLIDRMTR